MLNLARQTIGPSTRKILHFEELKIPNSLLQQFFKSSYYYPEYETPYNYSSSGYRRREQMFGEKEESSKRSEHKLKDLNNIIRNTSKGTTIDMQGLSFSGKSQISIKKSLKIANGTIVIKSNRLLIDAQPKTVVAFQNVNFTFRGDSPFDFEEAGSIVLQGGKVTFEKCTIKGNQSQNSSGIELYGQGCSVKLNSCTISGFSMNQVHVQEGAHVILNQCEVSNSEMGDGVYVNGQDSQAELYDCKVHSVHGNGVTASNNAKVILEKCQIYRSLEYVGISVDSSAKVEASRCRLHSMYRYSVSCQDVDSSINLQDCQIGQGYQYGLSLLAKDAGKIMMKQCKPLDGTHIMWTQTSSGLVILQ
eukprot:TRINITY_DN3645_c0_g3_i2.p1 TRINITY_DN3645_c0_g3~~TRINITY_DN3645_c0_g3_i2.p1  ORF type:complete len:384 (+),score=15.85 TRINITY_DN3645_c0_g3_i2:72-1154(+)